MEQIRKFAYRNIYALIFVGATSFAFYWAYEKIWKPKKFQRQIAKAINEIRLEREKMGLDGYR